MCMFEKNNTGASLAEGLLRYAMALFLLLSGIAKLRMGLSFFVSNASSGFENSFLPMIIVTGFLFILPFLEILLGLWLFTGWKREMALFKTGILLLILLLGILAKGDGTLIQSMFIYFLVVGFALSLPQLNYGSHKKK